MSKRPCDVYQKELCHRDTFASETVIGSHNDNEISCKHPAKSLPNYFSNLVCNSAIIYFAVIENFDFLISIFINIIFIVVPFID